MAFQSRRQGSFYAPTVGAQSRPQRAVIHIEDARPFRHRLGAPVERNLSVPARIVRLFYMVRPSAVLGRVRTVIVDAVDRVLLRWASPHVFEERREVVAPTVTHPYSAASIIGELVVLRVVAAVFYSLPCRVFFRWISIETVAVGARSLRDLFTAKTATTARLSTSQTTQQHGRYATTGTLAAPITGWTGTWHALDSGEPAESMASQVYLAHFDKFTPKYFQSRR